MNKAVVLLIITLLAASLACLHLVRTLRQERAQNAVLEADLAVLKAERSARSALLGSARAKEPGPSRERAAASASQPSSTDTPQFTVEQSTLAPADAGVQSEQERLQDPAYREALRAQLRGSLPALYPGLAAALNLSREESERLFDLLADQQIQEIEQPIFAEWETTNPPAYQEAQRRLQERQQQQQADLEMQLGPATYEKWTAYRQTLGERQTVVSLQSSLALAGAPMSVDQTEAALAALIAQGGRQSAALAAQDSADANASPASDRWFAQLQDEHERMLAAMKPVLTPEQYAHFEKQLADELAMGRASAQLRQTDLAGSDEQ